MNGPASITTPGYAKGFVANGIITKAAGFCRRCDHSRMAHDHRTVHRECNYGRCPCAGYRRLG